jgi:hypothetical protein
MRRWLWFSSACMLGMSCGADTHSDSAAQSSGGQTARPPGYHHDGDDAGAPDCKTPGDCRAADADQPKPAGGMSGPGKPAPDMPKAGTRAPDKTNAGTHAPRMGAAGRCPPPRMHHDAAAVGGAGGADAMEMPCGPDPAGSDGMEPPPPTGGKHASAPPPTAGNKPSRPPTAGAGKEPPPPRTPTAGKEPGPPTAGHEPPLPPDPSAP